MADYQRAPQRFFYEGVSLLPEDALPQNKVAYALNVRSYEPGTVQPRFGLVRQMDNGPLAGAIHSIFRLNDTTQFADVTAPQRRFLGASTNVYEVAPGDNSSVLVDSGYSGNPFTGLVLAPANSPRPYLYIGDSVRMRKFDGYLSDFSLGLPAPVDAPTGVLSPINSTFLEDVNNGGWAAYGGAAAAPTNQPRINTVVTQLIYDSGGAGFASVALTDMSTVTPGTRMLIDVEPILVQDILPAVASTTIAAILYDTGTNGLCSIQPTGSFSQGQLEIPLPDEVRRRYEDLNLPAPARITVSRPVDFPVNSLIQLAGSEVIQILSVAIGADGVMSFRARTAGTFAAGNTIVGIPCFRADLESAHAIGSPATANCQETIITPPSSDPFVAGVQSGISGGPRNWALINGPTVQASTPSDVVALCVRVSQMVFTRYVRLQLNLGSNLPVYEKNYFFYEWRANDLFSAIQTAIGNSTALIAEAQQGAVEQGQQDAAFRPGYGQETAFRPRGNAPPPGPASDGTGGRGHVTDVEQRLQATDGFVSVGSAPSRQLALGNDQWITLQCRLGDLTRVGTDATLTLASLTDCAMVAQFDGADPAAPITFQVSDAYLTGGYGPDVGATRPPYVYRYRYRSTITGERGNPSPSMRAGVRPHRGSVSLAGVTCAEAQCDIIDWFRFGGALSRWAYVGSSPNASPALLDTREDRQIDGGETLRLDLYQLWPSYDLPRTGTCNIAGTSVERVSGDAFDLRWAPDSAIIINGHATSLYRSPSSSTRLEVIDNVGSGAAVTFSLPSPTLLAQPLPYLWGGPINNVTFLFACGDIADPGRILWSHGNDPDASSDRNTLVVTSASEPLMNGFFYDGVPYVFSSNRLYRIVPTFGQISDFLAVETPCTKGLWAPWAFCVTPTGGAYFLAKDGIYFTQAGGSAQPITDPDLAQLFPQDGTPQLTAVRTIPAIDFSRTAQLKLTYVDGYVYFDYYDASADGHTLVYDEATKAWTPDVYRSDVTARLSEPGPQVETHVLGLESGNLYQFNEAAMDDAGSSFNWAVSTPHVNGGDARALKQFGDLVVDGIPGGGYTATPVAGNGSVVMAATVVPAGATRVTSIVELNAGDGVLSQNCGVQITGVAAAANATRTKLFFWEPSLVPKAEAIARRATDWDDLGYKGAKFIQGVVIRANTFNAQKLVDVQFEGGHVGASLTLLHDGETQYAYPLRPDTWTPFVAELVRLEGIDALPWTLLDWRWVWEPAPEAATMWSTQPTTFDQPGFLAAADGMLAYQAFCPVILRVYHDDGFEDYEFPASTVVGDQVLYTRQYQRFVAAKGKWIRFDAFSSAPFRLFKRDCAIRVHAWGNPSGYLVTTPFGGPSRQDGAAI